MLVILAGVVTGALKYLNYSQRIRKLSVFTEFLVSLKSKLIFSHISFEEIVNEMDNNNFCRLISSYIKKHPPPKALNLGINEYFFEKSDKAIGLIFANGFGSSDLKSQELLIDRCISLANQELIHAKRNMESKAKLELYLYSFCGVALGIIFI